MLLEIHCHTAEHSSCSKAAAIDLIRQIHRKNLHGVIITDHHFLRPEQDLRLLKQSEGVPGYFVVLSGQEITTSDMGDVLVYGAAQVIRMGTSVVTIRSDYPNAAIVLAYPHRNGKRPDDERLLNPLIDAVEIFNSNHSVSDNARGLTDWHRYKFVAVAGTDTHGTSYAGTYPTHFDHPIETIDEFAEELRKGHCRPSLVEIPRWKAHVRLCVQERQVWTVGVSPTMVKAGSHIARDGRVTGNQHFEAHRHARPVVCPGKAGVDSRSQSYYGKSRKPYSLGWQGGGKPTL
jgi:3',5'-nucleoside bisphosphate phosphatase